jgi:hypothetical protein
MDDRSDTIVLCPKCGSPPPSVSGCMADDCPSQEIIDMMCQPPANQPVNNSSTLINQIIPDDQRRLFAGAVKDAALRLAISLRRFVNEAECHLTGLEIERIIQTAQLLENLDG